MGLLIGVIMLLVCLFVYFAIKGLTSLMRDTLSCCWLFIFYLIWECGLLSLVMCLV